MERSLARSVAGSGLLLLLSGAVAAQGRAAGRVAPPEPGGLPRLSRDVAVSLRAGPAATRTIADVDVLADGRIAVADFDTGRVAIFGSDGRFDRFLDPPPGLPPEKMTIPRLAALPDGGLVLAEVQGHRFLFYDGRLRPGRVVPFGIETISLNGLVRHPSGDLYVVAMCRANDKILHRFDAAGRYVGSSVDALDVPFHDKINCSGMIAVDPSDGTLWLTRLNPYEILHLDARGGVLGRITRDLDGFEPPEGRRIGGVVWHGSPHAASVKIAVVDGLVVNSYVLADGTRLADAFGRDGAPVATGLTAASPLALLKRAGEGVFVRHFNGDEPLVEVWRAMP